MRLCKIVSFFCFCLLFVASCEKPAEESPTQSTNNHEEGSKPPVMSHVPVSKIKLEKVLTIGKPDENSDDFLFYRLTDMAIATDNKLYLLDSKNCSVIVMSTRTGEELFRFGRHGGGPGEFSKSATRIRFIPKRGIIVIDNGLRRATLFNEDGKMLKTYPLGLLTDDLIFLNDEELLVSRFLLKPDFKPLHVISAKTGKILRQFGSIVEPQKGLYDKIKRSPFAASDVAFFSHGGWMTRILYLEDLQKLFLIQLNPYVVQFYDFAKNDSSAIFIQANVPFPTEFNLEYSAKGESRTAEILPSSRTLALTRVDTFVVVQILSPDSQESYLDFYSFEGKFVKRLLLPAFSSDIRIGSVAFDSMQNLYLKLRNDDSINWIEKYKFHL